MLLTKNTPALILAPMEGVTDSPMRALMTEMGAFSFCVSEFFRVSQDVPATSAFTRFIPELKTASRTPAGTPVQLQLLGGDPERLAQAALRACEAGAVGIDLNFGCPAPTVNRHDGGATLLKFPERMRAIVTAVRTAVPREIPVSAKLRLGWENPEDIFTTALEAERGGAEWITIHARTKTQGYRPPVFWQYIGEIRKRVSVPVVANGDIWTLEDLKRCQEETGCIHFMLGRGALADPQLSLKAARFLGINLGRNFDEQDFLRSSSWIPLLEKFHALCQAVTRNPNYSVCRFKQWLTLLQMRERQNLSAGLNSSWVQQIKQASQLDQIFEILGHA